MKMRIQRDPDGLTTAEYVVAGVIGVIWALLFWAIIITFSPIEREVSAPSKDQLRIMAYHGVTYAEEEWVITKRKWPQPVCVLPSQEASYRWH